MPARSASKQRGQGAGQVPDRQRILGAAFSAFMANGYAETSTLEIATRARVSKRALYELVGNKQEMLVACISERAQRLRVPTDLPEPRDRETLSRALATIGTQLLREVSDPIVIAVFRLAIAEAVRAPDLAARVGLDVPRFKRRVRQLKGLGLTISLDVGYRLSPRGRAYLQLAGRGG